jgi:hypothetical protein
MQRDRRPDCINVLLGNAVTAQEVAGGVCAVEVLLAALGVELIAVPKISPNGFGEKDLALTARMSELGRRSWEARKKNIEAWREVCRKGARARGEKMRQARQEAGED